MMSCSSSVDLQKFTCAVCMDIFLKPTRIACGNGHVFCADCVINLQPVNKKLLCPQCRNPFQSHLSTTASDVETQMLSSTGSCKTCSLQLPLPQLRKHMENSCNVRIAECQFKPIRHTSQPVPKLGPNRSTFKCPFCTQANLDCKALIEHCNSRHRYEHSKVVCPVCASMPWGEKNRCSMDFIGHLNRRHKFEYDTYVDYAQDDDTMLKAAIKASLQEK